MLPFSATWQIESVDPLVQLGLMTGGVVILSLIVAFVFVLREKPKVGALAGLAIIALLKPA